MKTPKTMKTPEQERILKSIGLQTGEYLENCLDFKLFTFIFATPLILFFALLVPLFHLDLSEYLMKIIVLVLFFSVMAYYCGGGFNYLTKFIGRKSKKRQIAYVKLKIETLEQKKKKLNSLDEDKILKEIKKAKYLDFISTHDEDVIDILDNPDLALDNLAELRSKFEEEINSNIRQRLKEIEEELAAIDKCVAELKEVLPLLETKN